MRWRRWWRTWTPIPRSACSARSCATATAASNPRAGVFPPSPRPCSRARRWPGIGLRIPGRGAIAWKIRDQGSGIRRSGDRGQGEVTAEFAGHTGQDVDWVVGAALLVRREVLDQVGGFDEGYFMYSEELDLVPAQSKMAGWQIVYLPSAQIVHHEGKSSEQVVAARHIRFQTSKVRYFRKFHGPLPGRGAAGFHPGVICGRMGVLKPASGCSVPSGRCGASGWRRTGSCCASGLRAS